ncbi:restriction endonuclease [Streptomyces sp. NPDC052036]|uniref:restriction endonuclease n=1 Tax=Streptomyces sp. NPDC052036 TaxID=3155171 RepID=UPI0034327C0D
MEHFDLLAVRGILADEIDTGGNHVAVMVEMLKSIANGAHEPYPVPSFGEQITRLAARLDAVLVITDLLDAAMDDALVEGVTEISFLYADHLISLSAEFQAFLNAQKLDVLRLRRQLVNVERRFWGSLLARQEDIVRDDMLFGARMRTVVIAPDELERQLDAVQRIAGQVVEMVQRQPEALFASVSTIPMEAVDQLDPGAFERLIVALLKRDGFSVLQAGGRKNDRAADVIASGYFGQRFVFQCKHTAGRRNVGAPDLYEVNGTAKDIHKADIAFAVTNSGFTKDAVEFAHHVGIRLIGRDRLRQWAEAGQPLTGVMEELPPSS